MNRRQRLALKYRAAGHIRSRVRARRAALAQPKPRPRFQLPPPGYTDQFKWRWLSHDTAATSFPFVTCVMESRPPLPPCTMHMDVSLFLVDVSRFDWAHEGPRALMREMQRKLSKRFDCPCGRPWFLMPGEAVPEHFDVHVPFPFPTLAGGLDGLYVDTDGRICR